MNIKIQILIVVLSLAALAALFYIVKKEVLKLRYALPWMCVAVGTLICGAFPEVTAFLADLTGIGMPVNFLFLLGFCFLLVVSFGMTVALSKMNERVKTLTQELAILKKEVKDQTEARDAH
ncbi:MAG: DUF2304 domain-containing protein [Eubacteriales bacterium]|nr:DUF2304 domain-containing protein [Eubacteriales bacterium]